MSSIFENIKNDIKKGRHYAFLGQYEESLKYFKTSNEDIEKIKQNCSDILLKNDWKKLQTEILAEISIVQELSNMIKGIIKPNHELKPKNSMPDNKLTNQQPFNECPDVYNEQELPQINERRRSGDLEGPPKENRFPFGKKPFDFRDNQKYEPSQNMNNNNQKYEFNQNLNNNQKYDYNQNFNNMNQNNNPQFNNNNYNNNFDYYNKNQQINPEYQDDPSQNCNDPRNYNMNKNREYKDPDVWDPAPPLKQKKPAKNNNSKPKTTPSSNPNKPNPKPISAANQVANNQNPTQNQKDKRNYSKPWLAPEKKDEKNSAGAPSNEKSFLYHCYPDGIGPDSELIQLLEKDVVELNPNITFEDIAELDKAKEILQEAVLLPIMIPNFFKGIRRPWKGVLMFGPPGTGKTMLAKAVATQGKTTFFNVSASTLASKWKGESEKLVRILFEMARFHAPSTIFFDEVDALGSKRSDGDHESSRKVKSELLIQMDGISSLTEVAEGSEKKIVMVLAATNRPWDLDEALRRRLEKRIYIPLPTESGRRELFKIYLKSVKLSNDIDWEYLVKNSDGYSGADISNVCREAALMPMRKKLIQDGGFNKLKKDDLDQLQVELDVPLIQRYFEEALKNISKSVSNIDLSHYENWMAEFGSI